MSRFTLGVNYWPASSAMRMWERFDAAEIGRDLERCVAAGLVSVRVFLRWEDFQPDPRGVDERALARLRTVADLAGRAGARLVPTLFTGHMSGANWLPAWALGDAPARRFRTVSGGAVSWRATRDWWTDATVRGAQERLAREAARALAGHPAVALWDLGNENSNCWIPATRDDGRRWLHAIAGAIREADATTPITIGLHAEDLEEDRRIGPPEAAEVSDVLSMHGYPMYLRWANGKRDADVLPFLAAVTRRLGGKDVLFEEFGAATGEASAAAGDPVLLTEDDAARYTADALERLHAEGCTGAMVWCYADYAREIWSAPPLDQATHERSFGLWRADGSPKPAVAELERWRDTPRIAAPDGAWLDIPRSFRDRPLASLVSLYAAYRARSRA